jgi:hypothetical protein
MSITQSTPWIHSDTFSVPRAGCIDYLPKIIVTPRQKYLKIQVFSFPDVQSPALDATMPCTANSAVDLDKASKDLASKQKKRYCWSSDMQDWYAGQHAAERGGTYVPMHHLDVERCELWAVSCPKV